MSESPKWHRYLPFWRANVAADVDEEITFHVEARAQELIDAGATPTTLDDARSPSSATWIGRDTPCARWTSDTTPTFVAVPRSPTYGKMFALPCVRSGARRDSSPSCRSRSRWESD
jgi:hypothetical protein